MLGVFLAVILLAVVYLVFQPDTYTYTSLYDIAEVEDDEGDIAGLEDPNAVLTRLRTQTLPAEVRTYLENEGLDTLPFEIRANYVEGTRLISLTTQSAEANAEAIESLHQQVFEAVAESQQALVERTRNSLQTRLEGIQTAISETGIADERLTEAAREYDNRLSSLTEGNISQVASRSLEAQGASAGLVIGLAVVLGMIMAVMAAFLRHFMMAVRASLREESN
ncbi:hypothetical protein GCM10008094_30120 [Aidingimonas halophila]|nr:hypothetical protein GCM10008094_30120 [Aidingimonas halophila]